MSTSTQTSLLPTLIIPGIMSSGLQVVKSSVDEKHIGKRVWLNPIALGLGKFYTGDAYSVSKSGAHSDSDDKDKEVQLDAEDAEVLNCKSTWLHHLSLSTDMCTERPGNEIRAIPGLDGVDFLTEIATVKVGASYVFGPIIELLCGIGYVRGVSLDAFPYDWRVPPSVLEERDGYFTQTMERIERMYSDNDDTPVVLMCHSMGCKTGHYLLNFALERKGREWIDQYIHTYMALGAPHIGAPSVVASAFNASLNPLLDPMLSADERLVFARSLGSSAWLMPTTLPSIERNAPPTILCKKEGALAVEILATADSPLGDLRNLTRNKHGSREILPFLIRIEYGDPKKGGTNIKTSEAEPVEFAGDGDKEDAQYFAVPPAKYLFPTTSIDDDGGALKTIRFRFMERGACSTHLLEPANKAVAVLQRLDDQMMVHYAARIAKKHGVLLGLSSPIELDAPKLIEKGDEGIIMDVPVVARFDTHYWGMSPKKNHRSINMRVRVSWTPPPSVKNDDLNNPVAMIHPTPTPATAPFLPMPEIHSINGKGANTTDYIPLSGQAILEAEGLDNTLLKLTRETYAKDPIGPRDRSSNDLPPVKRTYAIYGVNLDTEVSRVCRRVKKYAQDESLLEKITRPRFKVDKHAELSSDESGHKLEDGTLFEHAGTPQVDLRTGERICRSGDGSVPYYSLQQSQVWAKDVVDDVSSDDRVEIQEIDGAEHREMLSDERFHSILVKYLKGEKVI